MANGLGSLHMTGAVWVSYHPGAVGKEQALAI